ncbi:MAG: extracellular solute-binding protein, partial [Clostridiales bacterium]|nr:extracellular solute-binding protein [Clostridiales bacterium]
MKKKVLSMMLVGAMAFTMAACGSSSGSDSDTAGDTSTAASDSSESSGDYSDVTIEIAYNMASGEEAFTELVQEWADGTGATIEVTCAGEDHESTMKTRMASGDLPDIWLTHGWSVNRYGEYLMDLSDQEWVDDLDSGIREVITTDDGELYALPITQSVACCIYNADVLEEAGVDPTAIRTWDDFADACQAVLDNTDATPIMCSLGDESLDAYLLEVIWPTYLSNTDAADYSVDALLDGSFDWTSEEGTGALQMISDWYDAGYFNDDIVSCKRDDIARVMASNEGAFSFFSIDLNTYIYGYNEDANLGYLPLPSSTEDGTSYFALGEGSYSTFGIWKDTEYPDACKDLLNYLSQPEIAA